MKVKLLKILELTSVNKFKKSFFWSPVNLVEVVVTFGSMEFLIINSQCSNYNGNVQSDASLIGKFCTCLSCRCDCL